LSDFDRVLGLEGDSINIWGRWTSISGRSTERVHVTSALVDRETGHALLSSLQSAANPHRMSLPRDDDRDGSVNEGAFRLVGWVSDRDRDSKLDQFDPWAGSVEYPPIRPSSGILTGLGLQSINDDRAWVAPSANEAWFHSELWGDKESDRDESDIETGRRLRVARKFLPSVLAHVNLDLIVVVEIERTTRGYRFSGRESDELEYVLPYFKVFLFGNDGAC